MRKVRFHSAALNRDFEVERIIGEFHGEPDGPTLIFFGGIHGNETAGVVALIDVMEQLKRHPLPINGSIYAITGNMWALQNNERFHTEDLNRIWTKERLARSEQEDIPLDQLHPDEREQRDLYRSIKQIFAKHRKQIYCIDLHTTSAPTVPFITLNDTLINRTFATRFPVPVIIGIEEFLQGPLLSWVMETGYPALAFEAGEHNSADSIQYHKAFVWLSLVNGGLISQEDVPEFGKYQLLLAASNADHGRVFEVYYRRGVDPQEQFVMRPGYANLQTVVKGEVLASNVNGPIVSPDNGRIFMPLYQQKGGDGFFLVREVPPFWLRISALLRKIRFEAVLTWLPGVKRDEQEPFTLVVKPSTARFLAIEIFHLLGYRTKLRSKDEIRFIKREYDVRGVAEQP